MATRRHVSVDRNAMQCEGFYLAAWSGHSASGFTGPAWTLSASRAGFMAVIDASVAN